MRDRELDLRHGPLDYLARVDHFWLVIDAGGCDSVAGGGQPTLRGLAVFVMLCSVGVIANVGIAFSPYGQQPLYWLAGFAGAAMGVIWNYAMSSLFVWKFR